MVEELFPAFVALVAEMDVDEGVVAGLDGLFDEFHAGVFRGLAALSVSMPLRLYTSMRYLLIHSVIRSEYFCNRYPGYRDQRDYDCFIRLLLLIVLRAEHAVEPTIGPAWLAY